MFGPYKISRAKILTVATAASGTDWTAFSNADAPSNGYVAIDIVNNSGVDIEYRRGGAGASIVIPAGATRLVLGVHNASQIEVRRVDQAITPVTVTAESYSV